MKQAEKFDRPIITFIDTPGAYPGKDAEERGQGEAIARNPVSYTHLRTGSTRRATVSACARRKAPRSKTLPGGKCAKSAR